MNIEFSSSPLVLAGDGENNDFGSIDAYLDSWAGEYKLRLAVANTIKTILKGSHRLAGRIAQGRLPGDPGKLVGVNADQDQQKSIDVGSHQLFVDLLLRDGVSAVLSEEAEVPIWGDRSGLVAVAIDPLDGSGNVGLGAPLGTIFSILPSNNVDPFLVAGTNQLAAGYVSYGNSVDLGLTVGDGMILATLNPQTNQFLITHEKVQLPKQTSDLAFNASVYRHLHPGMRAYVDDAWLGKDGPRGKNFNMRWLGAAVGDLHRVIQKGGLFFYVKDGRPGYENGRLRHVYECNPMAFLCEQAGGKATDGINPILELIPQTHHGRCGLVFGAAEEVDTLAEYFAR